MEAEADQLKAQVDHLVSLNREDARIYVQGCFPNPVLTSLMQQLNQAEQELAGMTNDFSLQSPQVEKLSAGINAIKGQIDAQVEGLLKGLQSKLKADLDAARKLRDQAEASPEDQLQAAMVATAEEEPEIRRLQAMIQNSPDLINAPVKIGDAQLTPLGHAANKGQLRVAQFLLDSGAEVNRSRDANSWPPLLIAVSAGHKAMVELLLSKGADVNSRDSLGETALHLAAEHGFQSVAESLLAKKADVNARDVSLETPLHLAARNGHAAMVAFLLAHQADVNVRDKEGKTPLDYAKGLGSNGTEIAALLRQHGALDNLPNWDRITTIRPSANYSTAVFRKGTNDWNRFMLLELIAKQYGFITDQLAGSANPPGPRPFQTWGTASLSFPDFKHVVIHRPAADGSKWTSIPADVSTIMESGDCSRDVVLQWGDAVEIPETDHPVSDVWQGFTSSAGANLIRCISRSVKIVVQGTSTEFKPVLEYETMTPAGFNFSRICSSFMVRAVLDQSKLIRFSSDLSRVKVTRRDPKTGKKLEWVINCSPSPEAIPAGSDFSQRLQEVMERSRSDGQFSGMPDLWLRDGDVIEVPEKSN